MSDNPPASAENVLKVAPENKPNIDKLIRILDRIIREEERKDDKPAA